MFKYPKLKYSWWCDGVMRGGGRKSVRGRRRRAPRGRLPVLPRLFWPGGGGGGGRGAEAELEGWRAAPLEPPPPPTPTHIPTGIIKLLKAESEYFTLVLY